MGFGANRYLAVLLLMGAGLVGCNSDSSSNKKSSTSVAPSTSGIAPTTSATLPAPLLLGAELVDTNSDLKVSKGDEIVLTFDSEVAPIQSANLVDPASEFALAVTDDRFGQGASVDNGSTSTQVTITLGDDPILHVSETFDPARVGPGEASGLAVTGSGKITGVGSAAVTGGLVDIDSALVPGFQPASSLNVARGGHTATLLDDGRVLVVGGIAGGSTESYVAEAEVFDPVTGTFTQLGTLTRDGEPVRMVNATATKLRNGRVLICGGYGVERQARSFPIFGKKKAKIDTLKSAFVFDPLTDRFTRVGDLRKSRHSHSATLLFDGRVLIAGGVSDDLWKDRKAQAAFEVFDPQTGLFKTIGSFLGLNPLKTTSPRMAHTATAIEGGAGVLLSGGQQFEGGSLFGLFKPKPKLTPGSEVMRDAKTVADRVDMTTPRLHHAAATVDATHVLVAGGQTTNALVDSLEIYDTSAVSWTAAGKLSVARTSVELATVGRHALVIGGHDGTGESSVVDVFDLASNQVLRSATLNTARNSFTATTLKDGTVLVIGGMTGSTKSLQSLDGQALASCELYEAP